MDDKTVTVTEYASELRPKTPFEALLKSFPLKIMPFSIEVIRKGKAGAAD